MRTVMSKRLTPPLRDISPPPLRRKSNSLNANHEEATQAKTELRPPHHMRIYSWNVNGVGPFIQKSISTYFKGNVTSGVVPSYSLRNFLRRHDWPQLLCLQEVKINPKDEATKRALERAANENGLGDAKDGPGYTAHYCLPRDKFNAKGFGGKVYGVATFIRDDFLAERVSLTKEAEWDLEGRVLITELKSQVVIINGYWVNGTTNPYRNPDTGEVVGTRHDRKREFHGRMLQESLFYEKRGWSVVLVGDMNIARSEIDGHPGIRMGYEHVVNRANFNQKFFIDEAGMKAVDVFRHLHGKARKYTYYGRSTEWGSSCDRVDLIMVSHKLVREKRLMDADILNTPEERGHSDHVPIYITLDLSSKHDFENVHTANTIAD